MAHAITYTEFGGPEVLTYTEIPDPSPAAGQLAVRVESAGVNPIEWKLRKGLRASDPIREPRRVGADGAGIVTAVGEGVDGFRAGDPVAFFGAAGAYATDVVVDASKTYARPATVSAAEGAALGIPAGTAKSRLHRGLRRMRESLEAAGVTLEAVP